VAQVKINVLNVQKIENSMKELASVNLSQDLVVENVKKVIAQLFHVTKTVKHV